MDVVEASALVITTCAFNMSKEQRDRTAEQLRELSGQQIDHSDKKFFDNMAFALEAVDDPGALRGIDWIETPKSTKE